MPAEQVDPKVWVTVDARSIAATGRGSGGATLRIVTSFDVTSMDPPLAYDLLSAQLLYTTCARLVNYPDRAGPAGSQLTAEVAQALPTRSADGRTYTFKIRPGFRFSPPSNQPVTAQTFKATIERALNPRMHSPTAHCRRQTAAMSSQSERQGQPREMIKASVSEAVRQA